MKIRYRAAIVLSFWATPIIDSIGLAQTTERVSVDSSGLQSNGASGDFPVVISADGRFVAFQSYASNLVAGDTNGLRDVFVHDRQSGATERVSVATGGAQGANQSSYPSISADGRFVAFRSEAANLVAGDTNGTSDIFVRDRLNATTLRVSVATGGAQANDYSNYPSISANGRFVVFDSHATNLVVGDTNGVGDVFVRDLQSGTTELVSIDSSGTQANGYSLNDTPSLSADGRFVTFATSASNLVAGDMNGANDVFMRDRQNGTTERVSVATNGAEANDGSGQTVLTADGRFVAFGSAATNLVAGDTNGFSDVFVHDRQSGTTERVSIGAAGVQAADDCYYPSISADGRCVAFWTRASNLVAGDTNAIYDVFLRDRLKGTTEVVSLTTGGAWGNKGNGAPAITYDGRSVAFRSLSSNLVAGDTNATDDVFVRDRGVLSMNYCTSSTSSSGCSASIYATVSPSASLATPCNITVAGVEGQKSGLFFYGTDNSSFTPELWAPGSTSFLCVKPPTQRTAIQNSGGASNACDGSYSLDWNAYQTANPLALGNPFSAGDKVYAQVWFRDPLAVKSTNLSNAIEMTYVP